MPPLPNVTIINVANNDTISTPASPPYFQVEVRWDNPLNAAGTVTLAATNGVTIAPSAGFSVGAMSNGSKSFSLSSASSVSGVTLTAKIDVQTIPPKVVETPVTGVTVNVT